jgi:hypothetical protein
MATPNYNCTQQELYTILETGWNNCLKQQTRFAAFKAKYTTPFINTALTNISKASELPDEQTRNEASETARILLSQTNTDCLNNWQLLKRYIADAYPKDLQKSKLEAAGQTYYLKASQENWDATNAILISGQNFISNNLTDLTANDNMPPAFQTQFTNTRTTFNTQHAAFLAAEENTVVAAEQKILANNSIFEEGMKMLLDGQEIFKNEEALLKQFIFAELLYLASGAGTAGVKGQVTDQTTLQSLQGATVTILGSPKTAITDDKGKFEILQLASGKYNITFQLTGYQNLTVPNFEIKVGTVSTLNASLNPAP